MTRDRVKFQVDTRSIGLELAGPRPSAASPPPLCSAAVMKRVREAGALLR